LDSQLTRPDDLLGILLDPQLERPINTDRWPPCADRPDTVLAILRDPQI